MDGGLTAGDILALTKDKDDNNFLEGNGILIILFFLILLGGFGGNGFGGNNGFQNAIENQNVMNKLDSMATGLGQTAWDINATLNNMTMQLQNCCLAS